MMRAVESEARVTFSGGLEFVFGGLNDTSLSRGYLNRTGFAARLTVAAGRRLNYVEHRIGHPQAPFRWIPGSRHSSPRAEWPPRGVTLEVDFASAQINATLFYELYDGVPIMSKWMRIRSSLPQTKIASVVVESIAANAKFGAYLPHGSKIPGAFDSCGASSSQAPLPLIHAKTDQAYGAECAWVDDYDSSRDPVQGRPDLKDQGANEPLLKCHSNPFAPATEFDSFHVLMVVSDSVELERMSLSRHRMTQLLAPHTTENPIFFHATDLSDEGFDTVLAQMDDVGFEMLIMSFGSGFNLESQNSSYINRVRRMVELARSKNIEIGGYDLIALNRNVGKEWAAIANDGSPTGSACFASGWYDHLQAQVHSFINLTGISMLETDGPYGGGSCSSRNHTHHTGLNDSVYQQNRLQSKFFKSLRDRGIYVNQPDYYFFQGGSRTGMGYDEQQFSLPRWEDLTISRAGLYDDTYAHLPTQGWMFLPISVYHAGGEPAEFEGHAQAYDFALAQYLGFGTAACYRGPHLWNDTTTQGSKIKQSLKRWVGFYKAHRQTLIQPIVHLRRPDLYEWDGILHVNPLNRDSDEVGVAILFNPTARHFTIELDLPLYYCGLNTVALLQTNDEESRLVHLRRDFSVDVSIEAPPRSVHTIVVSRPSSV